MSDAENNPRFRSVVKNLRPETKSKLNQIDKQNRGKSAQKRGEDEQIRDLHEKRRDLQSEKTRHEQDRARFGTNHGGDEALKAIEAEISDITQAIKEAQAAKKAPELPAEIKRRNNYVLNWTDRRNPTEWLASQSPQARFGHAPAKVKGVTPATLPKLLGESAQTQNGIVDELLSTKNAPLDIETIIAGSDAEVDRMAAPGGPELDGLARYSQHSLHGKEKQGGIGWPIGHEYSFHLTKSTSAQLGVSFVAWLFRDQLKARLAKELRAKFGDGGLPIEERKAKIAALESKLLEAQRVHERLCCLAEDAGIPCERGILHPLARLEIVRLPDAPAPKREKPIYSDVDGGVTLGTPLNSAETKGWTAMQGGKK